MGQFYNRPPPWLCFVADKEPERPDPLGMSRRDALYRLEYLRRRREEITRNLKEIEDHPRHAGADDLSTKELLGELRDVDSEVAQVREWYALRVLESLDSSARTLNRLTFVLVILTVVLAALALALLVR